MPLPVWLCLAFFVVATTASCVWLFLVGLRSFRTLRSFGKTVDGIAETMTASAARLEAASASLATNFPRLEAERERFRVTLARTAVIRASLQDVQNAVAVALAFYPRK